MKRKGKGEVTVTISVEDQIRGYLNAISKGRRQKAVCWEVSGGKVLEIKGQQINAFTARVWRPDLNWSVEIHPVRVDREDFPIVFYFRVGIRGSVIEGATLLLEPGNGRRREVKEGSVFLELGGDNGAAQGVITWLLRDSGSASPLTRTDALYPHSVLGVIASSLPGSLGKGSR